MGFWWFFSVLLSGEAQLDVSVTLQKEARLCAVSPNLNNGALFFTLDRYFNSFLVKDYLILEANKSSCY